MGTVSINKKAGGSSTSNHLVGCAADMIHFAVRPKGNRRKIVFDVK